MAPPLALERQARCSAELTAEALELLRGRTLHMIGDSVMAQQWTATLLLVAPKLPRLRCPILTDLYMELNAMDLRMAPCAATADFSRRSRTGHRICFAAAA